MNIEDLNPQYITDDKGDRTSVLISIDDFEALVRNAKDPAATSIMADERSEEPSASHQALMQALLF